MGEQENTGFVRLNYGGKHTEMIAVSGLNEVEFGRGGVMFSKESLDRMKLDADAMYVMCTMADEEIRLFEIAGCANMVFM